MTTSIPSPPGLPLLGNVFDVDPQNQAESLNRLADIYGPIYELRLPSGNLIVVSNHELFDEICDEKRFTKIVGGPLFELRLAIHDGLFTAHPGEHAWGVAHRTLLPSFGPLAIRDMFDEMHEILTQLVLKWARYGPDHRIDAAEDFTRLTLDSIAICAMDTRFNSFYTEGMHPFVEAMQEVLLEAGRRSVRPSLVKRLMKSADKRFADDIEVLQSTAKKIVADKRANPTDKKSLVNAMLNGKDPKTGEKMTNESIADNMITFLIAGHETTSGLMSFLFFQLMANPQTLQQAQREVDEVIGSGPVRVEHLSKLPYITACLRETLRLTPTITGTAIGPLPDTKEDPITLGGGKYHVKPGSRLTMILAKVHKDPKVYGDDADKFRPERMLDEHFNRLPKNAWKPFGNGSRACIGRGFAWQEAMLATTMLLQYFDFRMDDPNYKLAIKQTLTIKPKDLFMHATLRKGIDPLQLERMMTSDSQKAARVSDVSKKAGGKASEKPISIYFGGNMGTCESLAQTVAQSSATHGFKAVVKPLDEATDNLLKDHPVVIITASYEGEPPDNANLFFTWLKSLDGEPLKGVQYSVFGCGNRDWKDTFQRIPTSIDAMLEERGAKRLLERGSADAADNDVFNDFEKWEDKDFWPAIKKTFGSGNGDDDMASLDVEVSTTLRSSHLRQDVKEAIVVKNELLGSGKETPKRHIELKLPTDMTYRAGDYLAVLPINHTSVVRRVIMRFRLPWDAFLTVKSGESYLPVGQPMSVFDVLSAYVELSQTATRRNIEAISKFTTDDSKKAELVRLKDEAFNAEIREKRVSPLDLLERFPNIELPFGAFLTMLPQLRLRQYSISSSPLAEIGSCTLTWSVIDEESFQGDGKRFLGVASNYLSNLHEGDHIHVSVKQSHQSFHLPLDIAETPLIMICAGTGIAPFRGFVQERALQIEAGQKLAPALLFVGCQKPGEDDLHAEELAAWASKGAVDARYAYSRDPESSNGAKYVQDRFWADRKDVLHYFQSGAKVFMCGSVKVADGVKAASVKMYMQANEEEGKPKTEQEAEEWFNAMRNERFMSDVFD
ncbi:MAG: hypothetical protein Q9175_004304 [Cornicularia normoerica]